jgi:hypothetical protein
MMMVRQRVMCAVVMTVLLVWPEAAAHAQQGLTPVAGGGAGTYAPAAAIQVLGALDRLFGELDAAPGQPTPDEVRAATFRRRILELRLLIDLDTFAYERPKLQSYRDLIDTAYEAVGRYQDLPMIQKALQTDLDPNVVRNRLNEMTGALGPLRTPNIRAAMRDLVAPHSTVDERGEWGGG